MPECLPDGLAIVTYANEFSFLNDDVFENAEETEGQETLTEVLSGFALQNEHSTNNDDAVPKLSINNIKKIQTWMVSEILRINPDRELVALKLWQEFLQGGGGGDCSRAQYFRLADYIEYRNEDFGKTWVYPIGAILSWVLTYGSFRSGMLYFGRAISIPDEEKAVCSDLCRPG